MRLLTNLLISLAIAAWIGAFAIFSIQNIQPISLNFLFFETIALPMGVLLAFSVGVGLVAGAIAPLFGTRKKRRQSLENFDFSE